MLLLSGTMFGCGRVDYDVADLQLDIAAPLPADAETLHVCVVGAGELSRGAGDGRLAFTGLPAGDPATVIVEASDDAGTLLGRTGATVLDADAPWVTTEWVTTGWLPPGEPCVDAGAPAPAGSDTWLLALRFEEQE